MKLERNGWIAVALWCVAVLWAPLAAADDAQSARVDKVFAAWDKPDTPGLAVAVVRDGKIVHSRGYGLANLEYGARNTPATIWCRALTIAVACCRLSITWAISGAYAK